MSRKYPAILVRVPPDMKDWLERRSKQTLVSQNAEIIKAVRSRMEKLERGRAKGEAERV